MDRANTSHPEIFIFIYWGFLATLLLGLLTATQALLLSTGYVKLKCSQTE